MATFTTIRMKINALKVSDTNYTQIRWLQNLYVEKKYLKYLEGEMENSKFVMLKKKSFLQN